MSIKSCDGGWDMNAQKENPKNPFDEVFTKKVTIKKLFKKRRNFPHGRNAKAKITLICRNCGEIR